MTRSVRWRRSRRFVRLPMRWWLNFKLWLILIAFLLLSGCVQYDVGVNFVDANHGTLVQHIRLDDQITGVSRATAEIWLDQLATQAEQLGGQVKQPSAQELVLAIPFYNVKDLGSKFDQFFQAVTEGHLSEQRPNQPRAQTASVPVSRLQIQTRNYLLWQRHRLSYDLDLSSLSIIPSVTPTKAFVIEPQDLLSLNFTLNTPWGAEVNRLNPDKPNSTIPLGSTLENPVVPTVQQQGKQLVWSLKPGRINHLEASFALPSPLGIGAAVIAIAVIVGMFLRAWKTPSSLIDYPQ